MAFYFCQPGIQERPGADRARNGPLQVDGLGDTVLVAALRFVEVVSLESGSQSVPRSNFYEWNYCCPGG